MSKKHYKFIAELIRISTDSVDKNRVNKNALVSELIVFFKKDNNAFDGFRFSEACGYKA